MKNFGKVLVFILCFAVGASAVTALTWSVLYVAVPSIATETDKLFKWNEFAENKDETNDENTNEENPDVITPEEDENVEATSFVFENDYAKIVIR